MSNTDPRPVLSKLATPNTEDPGISFVLSFPKHRNSGRCFCSLSILETSCESTPLYGSLSSAGVKVPFRLWNSALAFATAWRRASKQFTAASRTLKLLSPVEGENESRNLPMDDSYAKDAKQTSHRKRSLLTLCGGKCRSVVISSARNSDSRVSWIASDPSRE